MATDPGEPPTASLVTALMPTPVVITHNTLQQLRFKKEGKHHRNLLPMAVAAGFD